MNTVLSRAEAINQLVSVQPVAAPKQPVAEALVACCVDLLAAGEYARTLDLLAAGRMLVPADSTDLSLRLEVLYVRAIYMSGEHEAARDHALRMLRTKEETLRNRPSERLALQICEGACLIHLNRLDEAVARLNSLRMEESSPFLVGNLHGSYVD